MWTVLSNSGIDPSVRNHAKKKEEKKKKTCTDYLTANETQTRIIINGRLAPLRQEITKSNIKGRRKSSQGEVYSDLQIYIIYIHEKVKSVDTLIDNFR